jgi:hypothetical protein
MQYPSRLRSTLGADLRGNSINALNLIRTATQLGQPASAIARIRTRVCRGHSSHNHPSLFNQLYFVTPPGHQQNQKYLLRRSLLDRCPKADWASSADSIRFVAAAVGSTTIVTSFPSACESDLIEAIFAPVPSLLATRREHLPSCNIKYFGRAQI